MPQNPEGFYAVGNSRQSIHLAKPRCFVIIDVSLKFAGGIFNAHQAGMARKIQMEIERGARGGIRQGNIGARAFRRYLDVELLLHLYELARHLLQQKIRRGVLNPGYGADRGLHPSDPGDEKKILGAIRSDCGQAGILNHLDVNPSVHCPGVKQDLGPALYTAEARP